MAIYVWEKVKDFVTKAGTTIFLASVIMWFILNFGPGGYTTEMEASFGAVLGKVIVPFFQPLGLGYWQIAMALIAGISAKEVVVTSCAVLFGISNINSLAGMELLQGQLAAMGFGGLNAYCPQRVFQSDTPAASQPRRSPAETALPSAPISNRPSLF